MPNLSYWEQRQVELMYEAMQSAERTADEISKLYLSSSEYLNSEADKIFEKYMTKNHLSEADAKRLLSSVKDKSDIDEMIKNLANGDYQNKAQLIAEIEAPAYQARIERLKQLQNQTDRIMQAVYKQEKLRNTSHYVDLAKESYYKEIYTLQQQTGTAFSFAHVDQKQIDRILNSNWSGKNYSERIWGNTQRLAQTIKEELAVSLITGKTNREVREVIEKKFSQESFNARRLVRTESNFVSTEMTFAGYEQAGIEKYRFLATLDLRTSKICRSLDNKTFDVKERKVGENCPPMHPWCRSTTVAIVDEELEKELTRSARDPVTGKTYKVPLDMSYEQWYDKYVKDNPEAIANEKASQNKSSDKAQHEKYKAVLGVEKVGNTIEEFQKMKYNDVERWTEVNTRYKDSKLKELIKSDKFVKEIRVGQQRKHIKGTNEYTSGRSYLDISLDDIQKYVYKYAGTGRIIRSNAGRWQRKEKISLESNIGHYINSIDGTNEVTNSFIISYAKNGVHIIPARRE